MTSSELPPMRPVPEDLGDLKRAPARALDTITHLIEFVRRRQAEAPEMEVYLQRQARYVALLGHAGPDLIWVKYYDGTETLVAPELFEVEIAILPRSQQNTEPQAGPIGFRGDVTLAAPE